MKRVADSRNTLLHSAIISSNTLRGLLDLVRCPCRTLSDSLTKQRRRQLDGTNVPRSCAEEPGGKCTLQTLRRAEQRKSSSDCSRRNAVIDCAHKQDVHHSLRVRIRQASYQNQVENFREVMPVEQIQKIVTPDKDVIAVGAANFGGECRHILKSGIRTGFPIVVRASSKRNAFAASAKGRMPATGIRRFFS